MFSPSSYIISILHVLIFYPCYCYCKWTSFLLLYLPNSLFVQMEATESLQKSPGFSIHMILPYINNDSFNPFFIILITLIFFLSNYVGWHLNYC